MTGRDAPVGHVEGEFMQHPFTVHRFLGTRRALLALACCAAPLAFAQS
jgi:hypothetical protein